MSNLIESMIETEIALTGAHALVATRLSRAQAPTGIHSMPPGRPSQSVRAHRPIPLGRPTTVICDLPAPCVRRRPRHAATFRRLHGQGVQVRRRP